MIDSGSSSGSITGHSKVPSPSLSPYPLQALITSSLPGRQHSFHPPPTPLPRSNRRRRHRHHLPPRRPLQIRHDHQEPHPIRAGRPILTQRRPLFECWIRLQVLLVRWQDRGDFGGGDGFASQGVHCTSISPNDVSRRDGKRLIEVHW